MPKARRFSYRARSDTHRVWVKGKGHHVYKPVTYYEVLTWGKNVIAESVDDEGTARTVVAALNSLSSKSASAVIRAVGKAAVHAYIKETPLHR